MEMSDFSWQHQIFARPEISVVKHTLDVCIKQLKGFFNKSATKVFLKKIKTVLDMHKILSTCKSTLDSIMNQARFLLHGHHGLACTTLEIFKGYNWIELKILITDLLDKFLAWHISGVASCNLTFSLESLTFLSIILLRTF